MPGNTDFPRIAGQILSWAEERNFKGSDPYDGLNSRLLSSFLSHSRPFRLAVIQGVKRCPIDLRPLLGIPSGYNPKGLALFLFGLGIAENAARSIFPANTAELSNRLQQMILSLASKPDGNPVFSEDRRLRCDISLEEVENAGPMGWGYNFPWQSRAFLQPAWFPTVVCSSFVLDALSSTNSIFYPAVCRNLSRFVLETLNRHETEDGICFSYSPGDRTRVYNASLFGARILAGESVLSGSSESAELALRACDFVKSRQREDGSWVYGESAHWQWVDNLHTGFVLETLNRISLLTHTDRYRHSIEKGLEYYEKNLFLEDGTARYYSHRTYPLDPHSFAQGAITLIQLDRAEMGARVLRRGVDLLWDEKRRGFVFQKNRHGAVRQIHLRWSQAWMFKALLSAWEEGF